MKINRKLREHTTNTAFNLQLTQNMISFLASVMSRQQEENKDFLPKCSYKGIFDLGGFGFSTATINGCEGRGLIYKKGNNFFDDYRLTSAGKHVFELLKLCGLIIETKYKEPMKIESIK